MPRERLQSTVWKPCGRVEGRTAVSKIDVAAKNGQIA